MKSAVTNILIAAALLVVFWGNGRQIIQTYFLADMAALKFMKPEDKDYFFEIYNLHKAPDANTMHAYADYYSRMLRVLPNMGDAYGMLGYCTHYLNDDAKAQAFLKKAVAYDPNHFWNYYNLAAIAMNQSRYSEAEGFFQQALRVDAKADLKGMLSSLWVYQPLLGSDEESGLVQAAYHLKEKRRLCLELAQMLDESRNNPRVEALLKTFRMELYAF